MLIIQKAFSVACAALVCLSTTAASASAQESASARLEAFGRAYTITAGSGRTTALACSVRGIGALASVSITACFTDNGVHAPLLSAPGPFVATAGMGVAGRDALEVCYRAEGQLLDGTRVATPLVCEPVSS